MRKIKGKRCINCGKLRALSAFMHNREHDLYSPHCRKCVKKLMVKEDEKLPKIEPGKKGA